MDRRRIRRAAFVAVFVAGSAFLQPQLASGQQSHERDGTAGHDDGSG